MNRKTRKYDEVQTTRFVYLYFDALNVVENTTDDEIVFLAQQEKLATAMVLKIDLDVESIIKALKELRKVLIENNTNYQQATLGTKTPHILQLNSMWFDEIDKRIDIKY